MVTRWTRTVQQSVTSGLPGLGLIACIGLIGALAIVYGTRWGPWVGSDSVEYFEAARNMAEGRGLVLERASGALVPLSLRPPLYPILLAGFYWFDIDLLVGARFLAVPFLLLFLMVIGLSIRKLTGELSAAVVSLVLIVSSPATIHAFAGAMSEAPFLVLSILSIFLALFYLDSSAYRLLTTSALLAGLSLVARYSGVAVVASSLVVCLSDAHGPREKLKRAGAFSLIGIVPILVWASYVASLGGSPGTYRFDINNLWADLAPVRIGFAETIWKWLPLLGSLQAPYRVKLLTLSSIALAPAILVAWAALKIREGPPSVDRAGPKLRLISAFAAFAVLYSVFIALAFVFVASPKPAINERILLPIQVSLFILLPVVVTFSLQALARGRGTLIMPAILAIPVVLTNLRPSAALLMDLHVNGGGYSGRAWRGSGVIELLQELPDDVQLISNDIEAIKFHTGKSAFRIPELESETKRTEFSAFGDDVSEPIELMFREGDALLVLFESSYWQFNAIYGEQTDQRMRSLTAGLSTCASLWDGSVYSYGSCP